MAINLLPFLAPDQPGLDALEKISCGYQALSVFPVRPSSPQHISHHLRLVLPHEDICGQREMRRASPSRA